MTQAPASDNRPARKYRYAWAPGQWLSRLTFQVSLNPARLIGFDRGLSLALIVTRESPNSNICYRSINKPLNTSRLYRNHFQNAPQAETSLRQTSSLDRPGSTERDTPVLNLKIGLSWCYFNTLLARISTTGGIIRPICFAVLRFIINTNFFDCSTGISDGLEPFRILSTIRGTRWADSFRSRP